MLTQLYQLTVGDFTKCAPGQFVFESNESQNICGFLTANTTTKRIEVCLFEPIPDEKLMFDHVRMMSAIDWADELMKAFAANPAARDQWAALLNQS